MGWYANQKARNEQAKAYKAEHGESAATAQFRERITEINATHEAKMNELRATERARQDAKDAAKGEKRRRREERKDRRRGMID